MRFGARERPLPLELLSIGPKRKLEIKEKYLKFLTKEKKKDSQNACAPKALMYIYFTFIGGGFLEGAGL